MSKNNRIIVTGGAGFIGSHLVERLLNEDWTVCVIDNFNDYYDPKIKRSHIAAFEKNPKFSLAEGDIRDTDFIKKTFQEFKPTHVVHLAARAGVRPSLENPVLYTEVNIIGTINLFEACNGLHIKNFIFGSSSSVYGDNEKIPFSEDDPLEKQISPYAITKRSGELIAKMYAENLHMPTTCLRFFTVYGPRQRPDLAIRKFMTLILKGKEIQMYGDGSSSRDYTFIDDIVDGIMRALHHPFDFEIINLGNSHPSTLKQMISAVEKAVGKKGAIIQKPFQMGDVERTYADISKAKKLLDWEPQTSFEDGLKIMAEWLKKQI